jgi:hypothetical protein
MSAIEWLHWLALVTVSFVLGSVLIAQQTTSRSARAKSAPAKAAPAKDEETLPPPVTGPPVPRPIAKVKQIMNGIVVPASTGFFATFSGVSSI